MVGPFPGKDEEKHCKTHTQRYSTCKTLSLGRALQPQRYLDLNLLGRWGFVFVFIVFFFFNMFSILDNSEAGVKEEGVTSDQEEWDLWGGAVLESSKQNKEEDIYVIRTGAALVAVAQIPCSERPCACVHVLLVIVLKLLIFFGQGAPHFHFALSPEKYIHSQS